MPIRQSGQIALAAPTQTLEKALILLDFFLGRFGPFGFGMIYDLDLH